MFKESMKLAQKFEVRAVPTFIIQGPNYDKNIGYVGVPSKVKFNELLDLSQGIEKEKEVKKKKTSKGLKIGKFKIKF
jgi:protein-disulfide isomerase